MDSASYWSERQRIADAAMERDERLLSERVRRVYERELKDLDRQVADYYKRYGEDNVIAYRHLMETLDQADRDLLIRDCDKFLISHPDMASIVDVRKSIYKLNRLEGLQTSARLRLYSATDEVSDVVADHLAKQALRGANAAAQAMGFGKSFYKLDPDFIRRFVDTPWTGGARYSQRIWDNADTLAAYVGQDMAKAFARGDSYERIAKALSKRFVDVPQSSLMRLVYTEGTYTSRAAQAEELKREGFEEYTVEVVHDGRTCEECHGVEGKTFRFDDAEPGVNFPPLHPYCRCQIAPAVEDWDAWQQKQLDKKQAERAANAVEEKTPIHNVISETSKVVFTKKQVGKKLRKHAREWGLDPSLKEDRDKFVEICNEIIENAERVSTGEWWGQDNSPCTFYEYDGNLVIVDSEGNFVTVMRGGATNVRYSRSTKKDSRA